MGRLQLQAGIVEEVQLEDALHALHASASALDFRLLQAGHSGGFALRKAQADGAEFSLQASRLRGAAGHVWSSFQALVAGNASRAAGVPRLLMQLRAAAQELEQSVELATLLAGQGTAAAALSDLHGGLAKLQAFRSEVRRVYRLSQERIAGRRTLETTLQEQVVRPGNALQDSLRPLLAGPQDPAGPPAGIDAALERRQELLAGLVQACAEIVRLHDRDHQLGARLATMAQQARLAA
jgi:hypothetical protein